MAYRHETITRTAEALLNLDFTIISRAEDDQLFKSVKATKELRVKKFRDNITAVESRMALIIEKFPEPRRSQENKSQFDLEHYNEDDIARIGQIFETNPDPEIVQHYQEN